MGKFPFNRVSWPIGSDNMAGLSTTLFIAPVDAILKLPVIEDNGDGVVRRGAIEMVKDAGFVEVYATYKTAGLQSESVGEIDCRCSKQSGEFFHPGDTKEMAKLARALQNTACVFIFRDTMNNLRMVGDLTNPAYVSASHDTGKKPDDKKGWTFKFEAYSTHPVVFYEGTIPTVGGSPGVKPKP